jgi:hypothetical protein
MLGSFFRSIPGSLVCFAALTLALSSYLSHSPQAVYGDQDASVSTLGPVIIQEPSLEITTVLPLAQNDVWIAGSYSDIHSLTVPLYEHFDGTHWTLVPNPALGDGGTISKLSAQSTHDIWAVGTYKANPNNPIDVPLIEHWNGSSWSMINQQYSSSFATGGLTSVVALSANNVWMVGSQRGNINTTPTQTFIEHWNGSQIQMVASPNPVNTTSNYLKTITATAANDIWSLGISDTGNTLTEHWDGSQWSVITSPNITFNQGVPNFNILSSASSISKNDVWAIGLFNATATSAKGPLAEHWNGSQWSIVSLQALPGSSQFLSDVVSLGVNNTWALGTSVTNNAALPLLVHWDGSDWKNVLLPTSLTSLHSLQHLASSTTTLVSISQNTNGALQLVLL